ncbi:MAG: transposase [Candidatus Syntropharchaeales archaeon]
MKKEDEQLGIYLDYLSPYSPDLNPIEFVWKSFKKIQQACSELIIC